jgi:pimeloyl-ACP methyl ester carboxylesterase
MIYYLNALMERTLAQSDDVEGQLSPVPSATAEAGSFVPAKPLLRLILAGYSYGSMIASHLPSVERVVNLFNNPVKDSAESEIQLRALHLASQSWKDMAIRQERHHRTASLKVPASYSELGSSQSSSSVLVGGFESEVVENRIEQESRRSLDVRKSLDHVRERIHSRLHRLSNSSEQFDTAPQEASQPNLVVPHVCYLLVSPVLPPIAAFATIFSTLTFKARLNEKALSDNHTGTELAKCPSLAVYGNKDRFTSVKKLRVWARALSQTPGSNFRYHEVDGAGHFWHETGVLEQMKNHIKEWITSL